MNPSKTTVIFLVTAVAALGVMAGTFLWLKLAPPPRTVNSSATSLEGLNGYGTVPQFSLLERTGKSSTLADLRGNVWIADFIYTTCTDTCPMQSAVMAQLQERFRSEAELRLVSFSVDPERDTPEVLGRYADRFKANPARWLFLTGKKEEITSLVQEGFRLSAAAFVEAPSQESTILHSPRFVLVDRNSQIRGYYDSRDKAALERLQRDVGFLLADKGNG
jgi:cytochrome oxidase Cu insertion factor (SCO1/SenC/PrrC family)